jgi:hypothetical protein
MTSKKRNRRDGCPAASEFDVLARNSSEVITAITGDQVVSDLEWFARHPEADYRIRDSFPHELDDETAELFQVGVTRRAALAGTITAYIQRGALR